jgi:1-deoxy-D-xylulose-5-phosphate synthase
MQRAYDQVIHDVCIQNLHVIFCLDRAGFAGADGPTHHGAYDLAYMRCIPNIVVAAPMDEPELRNMMYTSQLPREGAYCIRYPRGEGVTPDWRTPMEKIEDGTGRIIREGEDIAILTIGHIGNYAVTACEELERLGVDAAHYDMRFVKPLDEKMLHAVFSKFDKILTVEDGCLMGGFGSAVLEFMGDHGYMARVRRLGIPDRIVEHGEQLELHHECGFSPEGIRKEAMALLDAATVSKS